MTVDITFRTTTVNYTGVNRPLTKEEIDENFYALKAAVEAMEGEILTPNSISNVTVVGRKFTVYTSNGSVYGPFSLPVATFNWRGNWASLTIYVNMDLVHVVGDGMYVVLQDHTSDVSFDSEAGNSAGNYYKKLLPSNENPCIRITDTSFTPTQEQSGYLFNCTAGCLVTLDAGLLGGTEFHFRQAGNDPVVFQISDPTAIDLDGMEGFENETYGVGSVATAKLDSYSGNWFLWGRLAPVTT